MKLLFKTAILIIVAISMIACEKDIVPQIELTQADVTLPVDESTADVQFTANTNWTATVSGTWCTISPANGKEMQR